MKCDISSVAPLPESQAFLGENIKAGKDHSNAECINGTAERNGVGKNNRALRLKKRVIKNIDVALQAVLHQRQQHPQKTRLEN